jgi:hypothetical protein
MAVTNFEYEFWTVSQLQAVGLTPQIATSFNYFVRDVGKINTSADGLEARIEQNETNIGINAGNISTNAGNISDNAFDINYNFIYINGQPKPDDYDEPTAYVVGEYCTFSDKQYKCLNNTTGVFTPADWQIVTLIDNELRIVTVEVTTGNTASDLTDHEALSTAHGVTGDNIGNEDYCTESVGGVVNLAVLISDLTQINTADILTAPATYDQTYTQTAVELTNENKAKINEIVTKVNSILAGQVASKQMNSI